MSIEKSKISEINRLHGEIQVALRQSLTSAIRIGEALSEIKQELPHGDFTSFIGDNVSFSMRTAQRYLKLYHNREQLSEAGNLQSAYGMLKVKNDSVTYSPVDEILEHLEAIGITSLIPEEGETIRLFSQKPFDPIMEEGFDMLEIRQSKHEGYLNPSIYRIGGGKSAGYAYEVYNTRGGVRYSDTRALIRGYLQRFNFLAVDGYTIN